jgi:hypothetical protein
MLSRKRLKAVHRKNEPGKALFSSMKRTCDLILDQYGWWLQCLNGGGKKRCTLMDATNEAEA